MKLILFLIIYIKCISCLDININCPFSICRGYKVGSKCYELLISQYIGCITFLNKKNKHVLSCNNYFNSNKLYLNDTFTIKQINSCIKKKNDNSVNDKNYITDIKDFLNAKCIYKNEDNLIISKNNIKCKFEKI